MDEEEGKENEGNEAEGGDEEVNDGDGIGEQDVSESTLKPDSAARKAKSNAGFPTNPEFTGFSPPTPGYAVSDWSLQGPQAPESSLRNSGKSGLVQAAASMAALDSMSPASRRVYADRMMNKLGSMGLMERSDHTGTEKGKLVSVENTTASRESSLALRSRPRPNVGGSREGSNIGGGEGGFGGF